MYPTILIDQELIAEAHRLAREKRRMREAAAAAQARAARSRKMVVLRELVQRAVAVRWLGVAR